MRRALLAALPIGALVACSDRPMSLGSNGIDVQQASLCGRGTVSHDVTADQQAQLDELEGCQVIDGNLTITISADQQAATSLAPLASLRRVSGSVSIDGAASLAGLEALEQVGELTLIHLGSEDLAPLGHLQRIIWDPPGGGDGGVISISLNDSLRNLHGLEQLTTYNSLALTDDASLENLTGLAGPPQLRQLSLVNLPALADVSGLGFARDVDLVAARQTGLTRFEGFPLTVTTSLLISGNPSLTDLDGLKRLVRADSLQIEDNDALSRIDLPQLGEVHAISITDNDALLSVPSYLANSNGGFEIAIGTDFERSVITAQHIYEVGNNARLASITTPAGFNDVEQVAIWGNPSLVTLDLYALSHAGGLLLTNNPKLRDLQMPGLTRVGRLEIRDNPELSTAPFASVQTESMS